MEGAATGAVVGRVAGARVLIVPAEVDRRAGLEAGGGIRGRHRQVGQVQVRVGRQCGRDGNAGAVVLLRSTAVVALGDGVRTVDRDRDLQTAGPGVALRQAE